MKLITQQKQNGSMLLLVMGTLATLSLVSMLMLSKYSQNARAVRTPASEAEVNNLVQSVQQSVANPAMCSSALGGIGALNDTTTTITVPSMVATMNGTPITIASPGMSLNGVQIATDAQIRSVMGSQTPLRPIQITGLNYALYGIQPSPGPSGMAGFNCAQANLHFVVAKDISANRGTVGALLEQKDIPLTVLLDGSNTIQNCFGGQASNVCNLVAAPTLSAFAIDRACIDLSGNTGHLTWSASGVYSANLVCGGVTIPVPAASLLNGPVSINYGISGLGIPAGAAQVCTLTVTNSAGVSAVPMTTTPFQSTVSCTAPNVSIATSNACVNTGAPFTLSWTDADDDIGAQVSITGNGLTVATSFLPPASGTVPIVAPAAATTITYKATDIDTGQVSSPFAVVTVMASPAVPVLSPPVPASYAVGSAPANISLTWTAGGITSATTNGSDGSTAPSTSGVAALLPAPTASGTYTYTVTASGGCGGATTVTSNTVTLVVGPSPSPSGASPSPSCSPVVPPLSCITDACGGAGFDCHVTLHHCSPTTTTATECELADMTGSNEYTNLDLGEGIICPIPYPETYGLITSCSSCVATACPAPSPSPSPSASSCPTTCVDGGRDLTLPMPYRGFCNLYASESIVGGYACYATCGEADANEWSPTNSPAPISLGCGMSSYTCMSCDILTCTTTCASPSPSPAVTCGSANGVPTASAPSGAALCSDGSTPVVSGTGPWTWTCF